MRAGRVLKQLAVRLRAATPDVRTPTALPSQRALWSAMHHSGPDAISFTALFLTHVAGQSPR